MTNSTGNLNPTNVLQTLRCDLITKLAHAFSWFRSYPGTPSECLEKLISPAFQMKVYITRQKTKLWQIRYVDIACLRKVVWYTEWFVNRVDICSRRPLFTRVLYTFCFCRSVIFCPVSVRLLRVRFQCRRVVDHHFGSEELLENRSHY